jgi:hypothetical protein
MGAGDLLLDPAGDPEHAVRALVLGLLSYFHTAEARVQCPGPIRTPAGNDAGFMAREVVGGGEMIAAG